MYKTPSFILSSYRTYEEWKHFHRGAPLSTFQRSYRTYEEWKRIISVVYKNVNMGSYRTYEEWKLYLMYIGLMILLAFLPYL